MKIEISEESYQFLKDLIHEIDTQDNRATANPILYTIHEKVERDRATGRGTVKYYDGEESIIDEDEVWELAKDHGLEDEPFEDILEQLKLEPLDIETTWEVSSFNTNVFLTEKACRQHIRINGHNLNEPKIHVSHAFRNPEMEDLFKAIREIAKESQG